MRQVFLFLCFIFVLSGCSSEAKEGELASPQASLQQQEEQPKPTWFILRAGKKEWKLNLKSIGYDGIDPTTLNRKNFYDWLAVVEKELFRPPQSATFEQRRLRPHRNGQKVNRQAIDDWLDDIHVYTNRPLEVPLLVLKPSLMTRDLESIQEKKLGTYSTRFNPAHANRTKNIRLSLQAIDYHVVDVGEVFSFNKVVGQRTTGRGYLPAPIIVRGEYTEGIGGGICQTSSTLYNAADHAGLRIIERVSHSKEVTYVPPGRDATVSWGGPDFRFQNQLNGPILLVGSIENGKMTVSVYSSGKTANQPRTIPEPPSEIPEVERVPPAEPLPLEEREREENQPFQQEPSSS